MKKKTKTEIICNYCKAFDLNVCRLGHTVERREVVVLGIEVLRYHPTEKCKNPKTNAKFMRLTGLLQITI